ncbi:hypothetical protein I314_02989 [Cryptococcus bacillisporus CA1873]|uniref:Hypervirulence associated protein TUDOR domain-containing protein n=2 Tax=Cryptococcus gattii TaxID=552467 RepID=A0A0D0VRG6_CRYGA|nr:hypothetical protein I312_03054 [Cryptococcus bacillisporus CA1280]KIR63585.1 hypothetical protein I314_02989 [Cryptococcus bacillisporus CA1873]|eukprot:KIR63585.1 hypothetical protein I314_02989 [Cryptococcus gattii CA1873]
MSVQDKQGQNIEVGDTVYTPYRGGKHEGQVADIVTTKEEADEKGVKNPPKARLYLKGLHTRTNELYAGLVYRPKQEGCGT